MNNIIIKHNYLFLIRIKMNVFIFINNNMQLSINGGFRN